MLDINKNPPWFRTAAKCRYSGLPVFHAQLFVSRHPGTNYFVDVAKLGEAILLVKASGDVWSYEMEDALGYMDAYAKKYFDVQAGVFIIEDYADVGRVDFKARKLYIDRHKHSNIFWGAVFYQMPRLMRFSFQIAQRLHIQGKDAYAVDSYKQAILLAQDIIRRRNSGHCLPDETSPSPAPFSVPPSIAAKNIFSSEKEKFNAFKLKISHYFKRKITRRYSEALLKYIESIDWNKDGMVPHEIDEEESEDVKQVFEAISYIKSEIDDLLKERAAAEKDLREREARYRRLVEHARAGILEFDYATHRMISVNDSFLTLCGYSLSEITAMAPEDLMTEPSRKLFKDRLALRMAGESVSDDAIYELLTKKGEKKWVLLTANITQAGGLPQKADIIIIDITPIKSAETRLMEYQARLKALSMQLARVEERQRRELASRLHESVSQELFAAQLKLECMKKNLARSPQFQDLQKVNAQIVKSIKEIRAITYDLSPPVLYDLGLPEALKALSETVEARSGVKIAVRFNGTPGKCSDEIKHVLYRVVKELLQNIVKHARTDQAAVSVEKSGNAILVDVTDTGIGFDTASIFENYQGEGGFGLFDIREKIQNLGGDFRIRSTPGKGTRVRLAVPLAGE